MGEKRWGRRFAAGAFFALASLMTTAGAESDKHELIWPQIVAGLRLADPQHAETMSWARRHARHPAQLTAMLARAEPFLGYIVGAVQARGLPMEIALLPAVESGFDPQAHSSQKAKGLWQIVPWTGRALGLSESIHYDARRDPIVSTQAALGYLEQLHRRFGDWLLALAAYNLGEARLSLLIRQQQTDDFWALKMPRETRAHVPRLLGLALAIQQARRLKLVLPPIHARAVEAVHLDGPRDVERAARQAGIAMETIGRYNPGLLNLANSHVKESLLLPVQDAVQMRAELARRAYRPKADPRELEHVVAVGESLWLIARRYQVSVQQLADWNGLNASGVLRAGRRLLVYQQT